MGAELYGIPWKSKEFHGILWKMGIPWKSMEFIGIPRNSVENGVFYVAEFRYEIRVS